MNSKEWVKSKQHPCIECGQLCYYRSLRCRHCYDKNRRLGEQNPHWKGGRVLSCGYVNIYVSRGKRKREYRIVMEQHLGRSLTKSEIVHHLNGIRADNRLENLAIVDVHNHPRNTLQKALQARIQDLEGKLGSIGGNYHIPH